MLGCFVGSTDKQINMKVVKLLLTLTETNYVSYRELRKVWANVPVIVFLLPQVS